MKNIKKKEEALIKNNYNENEGHYPRLNAGDFRWHFKHLSDQN